MPKQKTAELIPDLIIQISSGTGVSIKDTAELHKLEASGIRDKLREVRNKFYKDCFAYDHSTNKWVVKSSHLGFLQRELLTAEEAVVLTAIDRNKASLGKGLVEIYEKIVNSYTKRIKTYIFKQHKAEEINEDMDQTLALLKHAINDKKIVQLDYPSRGIPKTRRVFPYQIVYIEYYWYLICFEEGQKIKSFRLSQIRTPSILKEVHEYNFEDVNLRLKIAMNAYVDFTAPIDTVDILVAKHLVNHVELASFFEAWRKTDYVTTINDSEYRRFEVKITNPQYKDIIPTILKYMPEMLVESSDELKEAVEERVQSYLKQYEP